MLVPSLGEESSVGVWLWEVEVDLVAAGEEDEGCCEAELDVEEVTWFGGGAAKAGINYGNWK